MKKSQRDLVRRSSRRQDSRRKLLRSKGLGGHLRFEPLEARLLLASDVAWATEPLPLAEYQASTSTALPSTTSTSNASSLVAEGESLVAEGEDAQDLVAFAKALDAAGVKFYGAFWCPHCTEQKSRFQDGAKYLPYIEVSAPDHSLNEVGIAKNITSFPTWVFPGIQDPVEDVLTLEEISQFSGVPIPQSSIPSFATIPDATVAIGSPLHLVVDAYDPNGNPLTITAESLNPNLVTATVSQNNPSIKVDVHNYGTMVFATFQDKVPDVVNRVLQLAQDGWYNATNRNPDLNIHRIINDFVIQFGSPNNDSTGGSDLPDIDDQYHVDLQHNRTGVLSFAKSSDDTNNSSLFVTEGAQRALDFNHSVIGQLVEGENVRDAISNHKTNSNDKSIQKTGTDTAGNDVLSPVDIVIDSVSVFNDTENGLVMLKAVGGTGTADVRITVSDNEGNSVSQIVHVTIVEDTYTDAQGVKQYDSAPFLGPIGTLTTPVNTPITFTLTSTDVEGNPVYYDVANIGTVDYTIDKIDNQTGEIRVIPPAGYIGPMQILVGVRGESPAYTVEQFDTQTVTINVTPVVPTGVDLLAVSDTGISNSDNVTNADSLQFQVSGVTAGATVSLKANGTVIGQGTASGSTITITTTNLGALGDGVYSITATQTVNDTESPASAALSVTLDTTSPTGFTSQPPTTANTGNNLNYDVQHSEEGADGFRYSLANKPDGASIHETTGVITWSPAANQIGNVVFQVVATDAAGNSASQDLDIDVSGDVKAQFRLETTDVNGNPVTNVHVGDEFLLKIYVTDGRGFLGQGVFAAYLDILAQNGRITPSGANPITHAAAFTTSATGSIPSAGVVEEIGGAASTASPPGPDEQFLASIRYRATSAGTEVFVGDPADNFPASDTLLYGTTMALPVNEIAYGSATLQIDLAFGVNDDVFNFDEDTSGNVMDVLTNDVTQSGVNLTITGVGERSQGGNVTIAQDGKSLLYTPVANFSGEESFTYTVTDSNGGTDTGTVIVKVQDVNDPPVAVADPEVVQQGSQNNFFDVLANDSIAPDPPQLDKLKVTAIGTLSAGGTARIGSSGSHILYTPLSTFTGTETFTYTVSDGRGGTATATVTVTVNPVSPPPNVVNDTFTLAEDALQAEYNVLANDTVGTAGGTLAIKSAGTASQGGQVSVSSNKQRLVYKPAANFNGTETTTYVLEDGLGGVATGTVTFTVTSVNDPPNAVDDAVSVGKGSTGSVLDVLANDSALPDTGETLTITAVSTPTAGGTVVRTENNSRLTYTPPSATFTGTDTFTYTISDGNGGTDTATVSVTVQSYVPRTIGGTVGSASGSSSSSLMVGGVPLTLTGTDTLGNSISRIETTDASGNFRFDGLAPGNYSVAKAALPFLNSTAETIQISSGESDSDNLSNHIEQPGRSPQYISINDFLGSAPQQAIMAAVAPGTAADAQKWYQLIGADWSGFTRLSLQLSSDKSTVTLRGTRNGTEVQTTVDASNARAVTFLGREGDVCLIRIAGSPTSLNFQPVTTNSQSQSAAAEGEGPAVASTSVPVSVASFTSANSGIQAEGEDVNIAAVSLPATIAPAVTFNMVATPPVLSSVTSSAPVETSTDRALASLLSTDQSLAVSPLAYFTGSLTARRTDVQDDAARLAGSNALDGANVDAAFGQAEQSNDSDWRGESAADMLANDSPELEQVIDQLLTEPLALAN